MSEQSAWYRREAPNQRFKKRASQALDVLKAAQKPMTLGQIRKKIVGCTSENDEWELGVALARLCESGLVVKTPDGSLDRWTDTFEISLLQKLAMEGE